MRGTVRARRSAGTPAWTPRSARSRDRCCRSGRTVPGPRLGTRNGDANPWVGEPSENSFVNAFTIMARHSGWEAGWVVVERTARGVLLRRTDSIVATPRRDDNPP